MTPREWIALSGLAVATIAGFGGIVRWLVSSWMRGIEKAIIEQTREDVALRNELLHMERARNACQAHHDRELSALQVDLAKNYIRREELQSVVHRLEGKMDHILEVLDELKKQVWGGA